MAKFGASFDVYLGAVLDALCAAERLELREVFVRWRCRQTGRARLAAGAAWALQSLVRVPTAQ